MANYDVCMDYKMRHRHTLIWCLANACGNVFFNITTYFSYKFNRENYPSFWTMEFFFFNLLQSIFTSLILSTFVMLIFNVCERFDQLNDLLRFEYFPIINFSKSLNF